MRRRLCPLPVWLGRAGRYVGRTDTSEQQSNGLKITQSRSWSGAFARWPSATRFCRCRFPPRATLGRTRMASTDHDQRPVFWPSAPGRSRATEPPVGARGSTCPDQLPATKANEHCRQGAAVASRVSSGCARRWQRCKLHRDLLAVLHHQHSDRKRDDELHHRTPRELGREQVGMGQRVQRQAVRMELAQEGRRRHADEQRGDPASPLRLGRCFGPVSSAGCVGPTAARPSRCAPRLWPG